MPYNVLCDHHRVVDDESDRDRECTKRHQIERLAEKRHDPDRDRQCERNHGCADCRHAPVAQEDQQHQHSQRRTDQHRVAHRRNGGAYQHGLVVHRLQHNTARQRFRKLRGQRVDTVSHFQRVAAGLPRDIEQRCGAPVTGNQSHAVFATERHRRHVAHAQTAADGDTRDVIRRARFALRDDQVLLVVARYASDRTDPCGLANSAGEIVVVQAHLCEPRGIGDDFKLAHAAALHVHAPDAGDARKHRSDLKARDVIERRGVAAFEIVTDDRKNGRREPLHHKVETRGQVAADGVHTCLHLLQRHKHVDRRRHRDIDLAAAANGPRCHPRHTGHDADRFLERARDTEHLLPRSKCAAFSNDRDPREFKLRIDGAWQFQGGPDTGGRE